MGMSARAGRKGATMAKHGENICKDISKNAIAPQFADVLDAWLDNNAVKLKQSSYVKYQNLINNHIRPSLGHYNLIGISSAVLNAYVVAKLKTGKLDESGGLSEKTVKDIMALIKSALRYAKTEGLLPDATINVTLPREKAKEMRVLTLEEQAALEKYLCKDMDVSKFGIIFCLYTGMRIGEICALLWKSIDLNNKTLSINRTMQRLQTMDSDDSAQTKVSITEPKSKSSMRIIPLPECLIAKLRMLRPSCPDAYFLTGETKRYIEPRTYQNHFKSYIAGSGIKDANFHALRHTFACRCVEVGFEIKSLSEILGHASVNITLNRYVHPSFALKQENMNKLSCLS